MLNHQVCKRRIQSYSIVILQENCLQEKKFRPDIQACVAYIFSRMILSMNYYKDRHLDIDILFVNKTQMFLILSLNDRCMYFKALLSKYAILKKFQEIINHKDSITYSPLWKGLSSIWLIGCIVIYM